jgi:non-ribosomal peptide synthetase component F
MFSRLVESYCANALTPPKTALSWLEAVQEDDDYRNSPQWDEDRQYWQETLTGIDVPASLTSQPAILGDLQVCQTTSVHLERTDFESILSWAKEHHLSPYPCFAAAVATYLSRMTGQQDLCLGCPTDGRNRKTRSTPGMLTNVLSLRSHVAAQATLLAVARQFSLQLKQALRHRQFPFGEIVKQRLQHNQSEPFSMLVNLESFDHHADFGTAQGSLYTESSEPVADLQLFIFDRNDEGPIELRLAYHPKRYTALQAHQHLVNIAQLTKLLPHYGQESIASLSLLDPSQRAGIIEASDGPTQDLSAQPLTLAALFAAQVAASPRAPALIFEQSMGEHASMDFAELDARSNQLARHLISLGCGPDHIVAVLLDRSPQLIVAMLAILKAGAAYLPLDPELPTSRLQFMLADSQTRLLLSASHHLEQLDSAPTRAHKLDLDGKSVV